MTTKDIEKIVAKYTKLIHPQDLGEPTSKLENTLREAFEELTHHHQADVERAKAEASYCHECGGTDVVCAKGVKDQIKAEVERAVKEEREKLRNKAGEATGEILHSLKIDDLDYENKYEWYGYIRGVRDIVYTMNAQKNGECPSQNDLEEALQILQALTPTKTDKTLDPYNVRVEPVTTSDKQ